MENAKNQGGLSLVGLERYNISDYVVRPVELNKQFTSYCYCQHSHSVHRYVLPDTTHRFALDTPWRLKSQISWRVSQTPPRHHAAKTKTLTNDNDAVHVRSVDMVRRIFR